MCHIESHLTFVMPFHQETGPGNIETVSRSILHLYNDESTLRTIGVDWRRQRVLSSGACWDRSASGEYCKLLDILRYM